MKILFFSGNLSNGGAERVLSNLVTELSDRDHNITIALNDDNISHPVPTNVKIIIAPEVKFKKWRSPFGHVISWIERNIRNYKHTKSAIRSVKPDVIVSFLQCNMLPIILVSHSVPIVNSEHNAYDRKLGFKNYFNRFVLNKFFDKVCVLTPFDKGYAAARKIKNVIVMPNPNTFKIISEDDYESLFCQRKNILLCGRIDAWYVKGFDLAIDMFAIVSKQINDMDLDIVGYGSEHSINILKNMAQKKGLSNRIHFLGRNEDMSSVYKQHKIFVLSSRTEGFPMVVTEAMSQGLPCVSFERLASSIIVNERDGLLVDDEDVNKMAVAVMQILENDNERYSLGLEAIKNVERFSASCVADKWENLFNSLIYNRKDKH